MRRYSKEEMEASKTYPYELSVEKQGKKMYIEKYLEELLQNTFQPTIEEKRLEYVMTAEKEEYIYIKCFNFKNEEYYHRICITADSKLAILIDFVIGIQRIWG